jgi:hypothetical protein
MVYHGLIDSGIEVYETDYPAYMLNTYPDASNLYGKGFTLYARLDHLPKVDASEIIIQKIQDRFYDLIIYGSVHRDVRYLEIVIKHYGFDKIVFVDGEDDVSLKKDLLRLGRYFKRECVNRLVCPISFGIPESQISALRLQKKKLYADLIPGRLETYVYTCENEYYRGYSESVYGITVKKAGWDCLRHYEILANRCVPFFPKLEQCPEFTLHSFPKEILLETNRYAEIMKLHPNHDEISDYLYDYTCKFLTTKSVVNHIFKLL